MEKIKNFILNHSDDILIIICLSLAVLFSTLLGQMLDIYNVSTIHKIIITAFSIFTLTFFDTAFQTFKHKPKK